MQLARIKGTLRSALFNTELSPKEVSNTWMVFKGNYHGIIIQARELSICGTLLCHESSSSCSRLTNRALSIMDLCAQLYLSRSRSHYVFWQQVCRNALCTNIREAVTLPETQKPLRGNPYGEIKMSYGKAKWMIANLICTDEAHRRDFSNVDNNGTY